MTQQSNGILPPAGSPREAKSFWGKSKNTVLWVVFASIIGLFATAIAVELISQAKQDARLREAEERVRESSRELHNTLERMGGESYRESVIRDAEYKRAKKDLGLE